MSHRLQFDLPPQTVREIDRLKKVCGYSTRAETCRKAFRLLIDVRRHLEDGWVLRATRGEEQSQVELI